MTQQSENTHIEISPAILYWGTPVCLVATTNPDGSSNIGPISSVFWLGHSCIIGIAAGSQTTANIKRTGACTLNLPSDSMRGNVNALANTTGSNPVPDWKAERGYNHVQDKFGHARLTPIPSITVNSPGIAECPVVMEAQLINEHAMFKDQQFHGAILVFELRISKIRIHRELKLDGYEHRIDTDKWKPLIMMFREFYGLRDRKLVESVLHRTDEETFRFLTGTTVTNDAVRKTE